MRIGELAKAAGVHTETLRYYERRALIDEPPRNAQGYRAYDDATVERVRFIKDAQSLGFSLEEVRQLLALRPGGRCGDVSGLVSEKLREIDEKIAALSQMRRSILALASGCASTEDAGCRVLDGTSKG